MSQMSLTLSFNQCLTSPSLDPMIIINGYQLEPHQPPAWVAEDGGGLPSIFFFLHTVPPLSPCVFYPTVSSFFFLWTFFLTLDCLWVPWKINVAFFFLGFIFMSVERFFLFLFYFLCNTVLVVFFGFQVVFCVHAGLVVRRHGLWVSGVRELAVSEGKKKKREGRKMTKPLETWIQEPRRQRRSQGDEVPAVRQTWRQKKSVIVNAKSLSHDPQSITEWDSSALDCRTVPSVFWWRIGKMGKMGKLWKSWREEDGVGWIDWVDFLLTFWLIGRWLGRFCCTREGKKSDRHLSQDGRTFSPPENWSPPPFFIFRTCTFYCCTLTPPFLLISRKSFFGCS